LGLAPAGDLSPSFFSQALAGRNAPVDTGRCILPKDILAAPGAPYLDFVGEDFNLVTTVGAFMQFRPQIAVVLAGASRVHRHHLV
jgi:hypothetical protein